MSKQAFNGLPENVTGLRQTVTAVSQPLFPANSQVIPYTARKSKSPASSGNYLAYANGCNSFSLYSKEIKITGIFRQFFGFYQWLNLFTFIDITGTVFKLHQRWNGIYM